MNKRPIALLALLLFTACRDSAPTTGNKPVDSGLVGPQTCSTTPDCQGFGICVAGVCEAVTVCAQDSECGTGQVCHSSRGYCVQCDGLHANECPTGQTCQFDFTCVPIGTGTDAGAGDGSVCSGTCTDRTQCAGDQVCRSGSCCTPPPRCSTQQDCPTSRPECNAANGQCFGGDTCVTDGDCNVATNATCAGGACICDNGACTLRPDECNADADCKDQAGNPDPTKVCTIATTPSRCIAAQSCTNDTQCAASGLICQTGRCRNGQPCPTGNECSAATQVCVSGSCVPKTCLNAPSLCNAATEVCNSSGQCVPNQSGTTCTTDNNCNNGYYCNTATSRCALGCRTATDCPGGVCDASHQCQFGQGGVCGPCNSDTDCPAGTTCYESSITGTKTCRESCNAFTGVACTDPNASCLIVRCSCPLF